MKALERLFAEKLLKVKAVKICRKVAEGEGCEDSAG